MAVQNGDLNPDGLITFAQVANGASQNSVIVKRRVRAVHFDINFGGTITAATVQIQRRGEQIQSASASSPGPIRIGDSGAFATVIDADNPAVGFSITAAGAISIRDLYPKGEYQLLFSAIAGGAPSITAVYWLVPLDG